MLTDGFGPELKAFSRKAFLEHELGRCYLGWREEGGLGRWHGRTLGRRPFLRFRGCFIVVWFGLEVFDLSLVCLFEFYVLFLIVEEDHSSNQGNFGQDICCPDISDSGSTRDGLSGTGQESPRTTPRV